MRLLLISALLAAPFAASAETNLLQNGSFEDTAQASGTWSIYGSLPGWTAIPAVELRDNVVGTAKDGSNYVELDAYANGALSQSFATVVGSLYSLSFWYSNRTDTTVATNGLSFDLGSGWISTPTLAANYSGDNQWSQLTYSFVANSALSTLSFMSSGTSDSYGTSLDAVSVTAVPEPSTYALMLGGLAAVGYMARRRRQPR